MNITSDISLGQIFIALSILTLIIQIGRKFGNLESVLADLVKEFEIHRKEDQEQFKELRAMVDRRAVARTN